MVENILDTKKQQEFEIDRQLLDNVINFLLEEVEYYKKESTYFKNIIEEQKNAIRDMFMEYDELADKYEDLFTTMMLEEDTAHLRKKIIELKDSLKLAESLMDFSEDKSEK